MNKWIRLDKFLADMGAGSRSQVKAFIRKGCVLVNGAVEKNPDRRILLDEDKVVCDQVVYGYVQKEYYMLNKPANVLSATEDKSCTTVIDLITEKKRKDLFPVGRLDKDTEGLLLITNDGELAHRLLSPKNHVAKQYYARLDGAVTTEMIVQFEQGIPIDETFTALPAQLEVIDKKLCEVLITIYEGKFHQIKRMFESVGLTVLYLKRLSMGSLQLDSKLKTGEYRPLTQEELAALTK